MTLLWTNRLMNRVVFLLLLVSESYGNMPFRLDIFLLYFRFAMLN
jgi:hypothetical protein